MSSKSYGYYLENGRLIYHSPHSGKHTKINGIDLESLNILTNDYCCDNQSIFHEEKLLKSDYHTYVDYESYGYFKIDDALYWYGKVISPNFTKDLIHISEHYFTDNSNLYVNGQQFPFDRATFQVLSSNYAKDKHSVFCSDTPMPQADPETFQVINEHTGLRQEDRDKYKLNIDPSSASFAYDKNNIYSLDVIIIQKKNPPDSIKMLRLFVIITIDQVYYYNNPVEGASPATFQPVFNMDALNEPNDIVRSIKLFSAFYKDDNNFFKFVQHPKDESLDCIKMLTKRDKKDLQALLNGKSRFSLSPNEVELLSSLLG